MTPEERLQRLLGMKDFELIRLQHDLEAAQAEVAKLKTELEKEKAKNGDVVQFPKAAES